MVVSKKRGTNSPYHTLILKPMIPNPSSFSRPLPNPSSISCFVLKPFLHHSFVPTPHCATLLKPSCGCFIPTLRCASIPNPSLCFLFPKPCRISYCLTQSSCLSLPRRRRSHGKECIVVQLQVPKSKRSRAQSFHTSPCSTTKWQRLPSNQKPKNSTNTNEEETNHLARLAFLLLSLGSCCWFWELGIFGNVKIRDFG